MEDLKDKLAEIRLKLLDENLAMNTDERKELADDIAKIHDCL